ncbi:MAG: hypothetical protein LBR37_03835 [Erysipelotrichaceae bacterium]|jgi:hypothetical protein|nr:hypothetical protein [Erysipelotrichaceae bacterium]
MKSDHEELKITADHAVSTLGKGIMTQNLVMGRSYEKGSRKITVIFDPMVNDSKVKPSIKKGSNGFFIPVGKKHVKDYLTIKDLICKALGVK